MSWRSDLRDGDDRCEFCETPLHQSTRLARVRVPFRDLDSVATVLVIECSGCKQIHGLPWVLDL